VTFVNELEPKELWRHFDEILTIPRGSGNESSIREYVIKAAESSSLIHLQDDVGNLIVRKPAAEEFAQADGAVLQCHLDMVNEKNSDVIHDFSKDPIRPRQDAGYLMAQGTTLGADNGIGIAAALAILESKSVEHGPLECLFTVDEETGLTGASGLSSNLLQGSHLINLDAEEEGAVYVGCAGGAGVDLSLPLEKVAWGRDEVALEIEIRGLSGGHSGIDIHLQRGNAISILARCLNALWHDYSFHLLDLGGGNMHNAIPREAHTRLSISKTRSEKFCDELHKTFECIASEFKNTDPAIGMNLTSLPPQDSAFDSPTSSRVLSLLCALPHGVAAMSNDIPGLVETSSNLATAEVRGSELNIHISNRSSVESALTGIQQKTIAIGELAGATTDWSEGYPGWQPNMQSELLSLVSRVHKETFGFEPEAKAVHAGLECGIIKQKYPRMEAISFGPQIEFPHSPDERVKINSVDGFFRLLNAVLGALGRS